jgi:hypothetical protein
MTFAHSTISRWNKGIMKAWQRDWNTLFMMHGSPIYALQNTAKNIPSKKFLAFAGFKLLKIIETEDGQRSVFVRR